MDTTTSIRFNRLLPYWAVLLTDLRQTTKSWIYRLWVIAILIAATGSILYKFGIHREAGIVQVASVQAGDLLKGLIGGSLGLIALLAVAGIGAERTTVADAVLSRGISRRQYFLAKLHARALVIVLTFTCLTAGVLVAHYYLFDPDVTVKGGLVVISLAAVVILAIVSWGVTIGALTSGMVIGITIFWIILYGGIMLSSLLPEPFPTPERVFAKLQFMLRGQYELTATLHIAVVALGLSLLAAVVGLIGFNRKDV